MHWIRNFRSLLTVIIISSTGLCADEHDLDISVFGNVGLVSSDSELIGYRTDVSVPSGVFDTIALDVTSKLGVQFSYQVNSDFDLVGQLLYRNETTDTLDELAQIAFLRYRLNDKWSIRVGRTPLDLFMLTEYRDIDSAIPWAKVPNEVYGTIPTRNIDGIDIVYSRTFDENEFRAKAYYGEMEYIFNGYSLDEDIIILEPLYGLSLEFSSLDWLVTLKYAYGTYDDAEVIGTDFSAQLGMLSPIWPGAVDFYDAMSLDDFTMDYVAIGGRYDIEQFSFYGELTRVDGASSIVKEINSGYISAVYHQGEFDYFLGYARTHAPSERLRPQTELIIPPALYPPVIEELFASLNGTVNAVASHQHTVFAGFSWHINDNWSLKAQVDISDVQPDGGALWLAHQVHHLLEKEEQVQTLFINLSFNF